MMSDLSGRTTVVVRADSATITPGYLLTAAGPGRGALGAEPARCGVGPVATGPMFHRAGQVGRADPRRRAGRARDAARKTSRN
jgi:hypothetical protein